MANDTSNGEKPQEESVCKIMFYVDRFMSPNSEKGLDYSIAYETKKGFVLSYLLMFFLMLLVIPHISKYFASNWYRWLVLVPIWFVGGYAVADWTFLMTKKRYKRFVSRDFNYWGISKIEESLDDEITKKELVEYMDNTAIYGCTFCGTETKWVYARRVYYKIKIEEQLELAVSILQTICWLVGIISICNGLE